MTEYTDWRDRAKQRVERYIRNNYNVIAGVIIGFIAGVATRFI